MILEAFVILAVFMMAIQRTIWFPFPNCCLPQTPCVHCADGTIQSTTSVTVTIEDITKHDDQQGPGTVHNSIDQGDGTCHLLGASDFPYNVGDYFLNPITLEETTVLQAIGGGQYIVDNCTAFPPGIQNTPYWAFTPAGCGNCPDLNGVYVFSAPYDAVGDGIGLNVCIDDTIDIPVTCQIDQILLHIGFIGGGVQVRLIGDCDPANHSCVFSGAPMSDDFCDGNEPIVINALDLGAQRYEPASPCFFPPGGNWCNPRGVFDFDIETKVTIQITP